MLVLTDDFMTLHAAEHSAACGTALHIQYSARHSR